MVMMEVKDLNKSLSYGSLCEVLDCNKGVIIIGKFLVSSSYVCNDDHERGGRSNKYS